MERHGNTARVTIPAPAPSQPVLTSAGDAAWQKVRAMGDIQFSPPGPPPAPPTPPKPPEWLAALAKRLGDVFSPLGRWLAQYWTLIEVAAALALALGIGWMIWRAVRDRRFAAAQPDDSGPDWQPAAATVALLLADADALAAPGHYDAAGHRLLRRSFDDIARTRPDWLTPASTAREIAGLGALPGAARAAFAVIAGEVERSRYALRPLGDLDWTRARAAYAAFAVPARGRG